MKKFFSLIFMFLFIISISSVYAVEINMDIDDTIIDEQLNNTVQEAYSNITEEDPIDNVPGKVSTTSTSEDFHLTISDIINIILISVGIVLIFLAIAILLKIK